MGQRIVQFSDISGKEVPEGEKIGRIVVEYGDARKGIYLLDATDAEIEELAKKGRRSNRTEAGEALHLNH